MQIRLARPVGGGGRGRTAPPRQMSTKKTHTQ